MSGKWLELLKQIAPHVKHAAVIRNPRVASGSGQYGAIQAVAPFLGMETSAIDARDAGEIERGIARPGRSSPCRWSQQPFAGTNRPDRNLLCCERNEERSSASAPLTRRAGLFFCVACQSAAAGRDDRRVGVARVDAPFLSGRGPRDCPTARPRHGATVAGFLRSVRGGRPPQNAHFCDRRHMASAMAGLASYLWIVPRMWSFYVPPKYSAPLTRGFFLRRATSCVEAAWGEVFDVVTDCVAAN
jgi:hypothetical protein